MDRMVPIDREQLRSVGGHVGFGGERGDDGVEEVAAAAPVDGGHGDGVTEPEPGERPEVGLASVVVDLVGDDEDGMVAALEQPRDAGVFVGDRSQNDIAPWSQNTTSNDSAAKGVAVAVAATSGNDIRCSC